MSKLTIRRKTDGQRLEVTQDEWSAMINRGALSRWETVKPAPVFKKAATVTFKDPEPPKTVKPAPDTDATKK